MTPVAAQRRFVRQHPCPICGGYDGAVRGKGKRCFGFVSGDGQYAHCTREEHAGALEQLTNTSTFAHRLGGACRCGTRHGEPKRSRPDGLSSGIVATYDYVSEKGVLLFQVVRSQPKKFKQRRPDGKGGWIWNVKDVRRVPYRLRELLSAPPGETVFIVEGEKDVDNLCQLGLIATCNPGGAGKWNVIADEAAKLLGGRPVVVIADKDDVGRTHARQVAHTLHRVAASVRVIEVPGAGKDASGWIEEGGTADELRALASAAPEWRPALGVDIPTTDRGDGGGGEVGPYRVENGRYYWVKPSRDPESAPILVPLSNFDAQIVEEVRLDDGAEVSRVFGLHGKLDDGTGLPEARVAAAEFGGLGWVSRDWGARAVVTAGMGARDRLREAIQRFSRPIVHTVYRHSGWRVIDGQWVYLFQDGAVGASGVSVELDPPLDRLVLPRSPEDLVEAVRVSLSLLECGPAAVTVPLLGATYLAPVASVIRPDFALWLFGPTGNLKSELAALAQAHFGRFDRKSLPASWTSTDTSLEGRTFTLKDAVCVIDDYAPVADFRAQKELERRAQRILRGVGNVSARGRSRADLTARPDRPPRGVVICTGEDVPPGSSLVARLVVVEVDRSRLVLDRISTLQGLVGRLPHAMRAYLEWLRPQMDVLGRQLTDMHLRARARFQGGEVHLRQPEALAHLYVGIDLLLHFATEIGALDGQQADGWRETAYKALLAIGARQVDQQREIDPAERFIRVLQSLLTQGRIKLVGRDLPLDQREGDAGHDPPVCEPIGWRDEEHAYLMPELVRRRVVAFLRDAGDHWPHSARALHQALVRRGYVQPGPDGRPETQVRCGGDKHRVLKMPTSVLQPDRAVPASVPGVPGLSPLLFASGDSPAAPPTDGETAREEELSPLSPVLSGGGGERGGRGG